MKSSRFRSKRSRGALKSNRKGKVSLRVPTLTKALIKSVCKNVVSRNTENKSAYLQVPSSMGTYNSFNNTISLADWVNVIPNISQGTASGQRLGNEIKSKGIYVKGTMNVVFPSTSGAVTTGLNLYVRMLCVVDKLQAGAGVGTTAILERNGVATSVGGYPQDLYSPIDKDRFTVLYDKIIKLQNPNFNTSTTGYINANINVSRYFRFKLKGRMLKYTDNSSYTPTNYLPQFACFVVDPSLTLAGNSPTITPCQYTLSSTMYYEDA